jgi:hypothetical protein
MDPSAAGSGSSNLADARATAVKANSALVEANSAVVPAMSYAERANDKLKEAVHEKPKSELGGTGGVAAEPITVEAALVNLIAQLRIEVADRAEDLVAEIAKAEEALSSSLPLPSSASSAPTMLQPSQSATIAAAVTPDESDCREDRSRKRRRTAATNSGPREGSPAVSSDDSEFSPTFPLP